MSAFPGVELFCELLTLRQFLRRSHTLSGGGEASEAKSEIYILGRDCGVDQTRYSHMIVIQIVDLICMYICQLSKFLIDLVSLGIEFSL